MQVRTSSQKMLKLLRKKPDAGTRDVVETEQKEALMQLVRSLLERCDTIRDETLADLGIQLEDTADGAIWKKSTRYAATGVLVDFARDVE